MNDADESPQGVVGFFGTSERSGDIRIQNNHHASRYVTGCIRIALGLAEIVLREYLVNIGPIGGTALILSLLQSFSIQNASPAAR